MPSGYYEDIRNIRAVRATYPSPMICELIWFLEIVNCSMRLIGQDKDSNFEFFVIQASVKLKEWRRNKKVIYRKRDLRAHLFFNKRSLLQGRAISRQSQVCRVSQLSSLLRNRRRSPKEGCFDTSRTFADFFVGSVRTPPLA